MAGECIVAGNTRTGRLFHLGSGNWEGERLAKGGRFETRKWFDMGKSDALKRWEEWRAEGERESMIRVERKTASKQKKVEGAEMNKEAKEEVVEVTKPTDRNVWLLTFTNGRLTKVIAAYEDEDSALRMAAALETAAEVSGMTGEYGVDQAPVWG